MVVLFVHFDFLLFLSLGLLGVRVVDGQQLRGDLGSHYRWDRGWGYHDWWRFILSTQTDVTFVRKVLDTVREARVGSRTFHSHSRGAPSIVAEVSPHLIILVYFSGRGLPGQ